jgi:chemotaxis response regulator CheB
MVEIIDYRPPQQRSVPSFGAKVIRVLIIVDHVRIRAGIRILLGNQDGIGVVGEASNAEEALAIASSEWPDIILLNVDVARDLQLLPELYRITPEARVIVVTGMNDSDTHRRMAYLASVFVKLNVVAPLALVIFAYRRGLSSHPR